MIKKTVKELNYEDFYKYGTYSAILSPKGIKFGNEHIEFYRDMIQLDMGQTSTVSFSLCRILKRELIIDTSEYHNYTGEMIMPIDCDILIHVGAAIDNDKVPVNDIEIYRIPKGTVVCIRPGVWHHAAFVYNCDEANILVALPERTYKNDCHVIELDAEEQIEIKL